MQTHVDAIVPVKGGHTNSNWLSKKLNFFSGVQD